MPVYRLGIFSDLHVGLTPSASCKRHRGAFTAAVFLLSLTATLWAEPLRLVIPPTPGAKDQCEDAERVAICLSLYLQESLRGSPGVRLVSESRAVAILGELRGGSRDLEDNHLQPVFSSMAPVDAILDYRLSDGKVMCALHAAGGVSRREIPFARRGSMTALAEALAAFLVSELKLDAETAALLTARRVEKKDYFEAYYVSQVLSASWIMNTGEMRLKMLAPYLSRHPKDPLVAARVLRSAQDMIADPRKDLLKSFQNVGLTMAWMVLPMVLGTPLEDSTHGILRSQPDRFEEDLLAMAGVLTGDSTERTMDETKPEAGGGLVDIGASGESGAGRQPGADYVAPTMEQRLGALRCLGVAQSKKAMTLLKPCAVNEDPQTREAAAIALRYYENEFGLDLLNALARDQEPAVAFAACYGLWKRGQAPARLLALARGMTADKSRRAMALEALAGLGTREDIPVLAGVRQDPAPEIRTFAAQGLLRLEAVDARRFLSDLNDPDETIVVCALSAWRGNPAAEALARMEALANDPFAPVAQSARLALAGRRPTQAKERDLFDLKIEHNYIRMQIVDALATNREPWSLEVLEQACGNRDAHTRAHALARLLERDPARGRHALARAIADPHRWVRLHAAALLAGVAGNAEAEAIRKAAAVEKDEVIGLYLADALARAEGRPLPAPRPAVHSIAGKENLAWQCGYGTSVEKSPAEAYYFCGRPSEPSEDGKRAYRAGKIFIPRVDTVYYPWQILSDPACQDGFWLMMQSQLTTNTLPWCDGLVFGEENMEADSRWMWGSGWPLFCRDAGIDPNKIEGDRRNLSFYEARAWDHWSSAKVIEGFNILYDYVKMYYGKLRPGLQVGTFLPGQGGVTPADKRWKFDFGGCYWYQGSNREMYTYIRRFKTLWPDRPIVWLANGCTRLYGNLNRGSGPKHDAPYPTEIMAERWERPYADNISAWLAGADSGWFGFFGAENDKQSSILFLHNEDLYPGSARLETGMSNYAAYVETVYRAETELTNRPPDIADTKIETKDETDPLLLDEENPEDDPARRRAREFRVRTRRSFLIMGKYVQDCIRVFASLPRLNPQPQALMIHPHDWPGGRRFNAPGLALLNAYDYLPDLNQAASDLDLDRYRIIAVSGMDNAPLMDSTLVRVTGWLKERPGLLYVHGTLCAANTNEAGTAENHDGILRNDWPWEKEVSIAVSNYSISGPSAQALVSGPTGPVRVLWQGPGFKGAVIFDTGFADVNDLRKTVNALHAERKIGLELKGPAGQETWREHGLEAASACDSLETNVMKGVDLLTGEANPQVGPGRAGALVARDFTGKYVAAWNGVAILCDQPIGKVQAVEGGLRVECPGLIRAGSETGAAVVRREGGGELPSLSGVSNITTWVLTGKEEGQAVLPIGTSGSTATYVRSKQPVVITQKK